MLKLAVLDHEPVTGPVGVDRQSGLPAADSGITQQPVELVLRQRSFAEDLVAQAHHIRLVTVASRPHAPASCHRGRRVVQDDHSPHPRRGTTHQRSGEAGDPAGS
ncbi:hypothetical protein ACWGN5_25885 [Streptomyces sp. NPDC055815]